MSDREFDLVLLGATGFVGSLTAAHLVQAAGSARVALAGRSADRLAALRDGLGEAARDWALVEVDARDARGLSALAGRSRVLATTVGPYARYGRDVVRAAAERGAHYADLTGEVSFVAWTRAELDGLARRTGARIVHSCGFDSIPSDLGVLVTAERAAEDGEGALAEATLVVRALRGGLSGGTIDSLRQEVIAARRDPAVRRVVRDQDSLLPEGARTGHPPRSLLQRVRERVPVERDPGTGRWLGPFVMAGFNTRIVQLSAALGEAAFAPGFRYREVSDLGAGPAGPVRAVGMALGLGALSAALSWRPTRALLDRVLPRPGEGPDARQRARGRFRMEIDAVTTTGARYRTTVAADRDPGYGGTAIMLGQSALCLALDEGLPERAGVLTPATALGDALVDRLRANGFTFEVERKPR